MSETKWGWMFNDPHDATDRRANGPFDSYDDALADAYASLCSAGCESTTVIIDHMYKPDFLEYFPNAEDLAEQAGEAFTGSNGSCDDYIFALAGEDHEVTEELVRALRPWAARWVVNNVEWWMDASGERIHIRADDEYPTAQSAALDVKETPDA